MTRNIASLPTTGRAWYQGFTLIELMIVIAIIAIILTLAIPVYSNYAIRAKVTEGLSVANSAKTAIGAACIEDPNMVGLTNDKAGYSFKEGTGDEDYVSDVQASGACAAPVLTVTTKNTGQSPDPEVILTGTLSSGHLSWVCHSDNTHHSLLPNRCRS